MAESLLNQIEADLKKALKARDREVLDALRLLKSDIQLEIGRATGSSLTDTEIVTLIKRGVKRRRDSIDQFKKSGKNDMAKAEEIGLAILERYLPEGMDEEEIRKVVQAVISEAGNLGPSDMGKAMGAVMGRLKGQNADGALVKKIVMQSLNA